MVNTHRKELWLSTAGNWYCLDQCPPVEYAKDDEWQQVGQSRRLYWRDPLSGRTLNNTRPYRHCMPVAEVTVGITHDHQSTPDYRALEDDTKTTIRRTIDDC